MSGIGETLGLLGTELVACEDGCSGIVHDRAQGILPRSLFLERGASAERGSVAVGINPGKSSDRERRYMLGTSPTYERLNEWRASISEKPYFKRTRGLIDALGLAGPILWSNLAKCENTAERREPPPLQTLRHCTRRFLRRELDVIPRDWAVIAIGWEAFRALAYLLPDRCVIGIPHPTGGFRTFRKLYDDSKQLRRDILMRAIEALKTDDPKAAWLGASKAGA